MILLQSLFLFFCLLLLLLFTLEIIYFYLFSFLTWKLRWLILDFSSFLLLLLFSHSVMTDSLRPHGLQHARPPVLHSLWELAQTPVHESIMPSNHLILCWSLLLPSIFPSIRVLKFSESAFCIRWPILNLQLQPSVLPMNIQGWFPLGLTSLIPLQSKGFSRVFSSTKVWKNGFFSIICVQCCKCSYKQWIYCSTNFDSFNFYLVQNIFKILLKLLLSLLCYLEMCC